MSAEKQCKEGGFIDWMKKEIYCSGFLTQPACSFMSLNPHVGPLATSVCRAAFWFRNDIRKCVFSAEEELRVGGSWQRKEGGQSGKEKKRKAQDEEQWKGRCSKVPVVSQFGVHALITDVAWGEWRTNSGSCARWGLLIMRFQLTFNPKPLWASCLLLFTPHW